MKILGLNGWSERGHDGGASLIINGKLIAAIEEEKLIGKRHAYDCLPIESIKYVLNIGDISIDDLDKIYIGWNYPALFKMINQEFISNEEISKILFNDERYAEKIEYVDHHIAHAYSAFFPSNYEEALVLVVDGQGELMGTSLYQANKKEKKLKLLMESVTSLGYFYAAVTEQIGFKSGEEGKTMGLASYGKSKYYDKLKDYIFLDDNGILKCKFEIPKVSKDEEDETINKWKELFEKIIKSREGKILEVKDEIWDYADFANSAQKVLETTMREIITFYFKKTGINKVVIAGGVGLNCTANSAIESLPFIEDVFIQPAANDGGISLGAALKGAVDLGDEINFEMIPYLGPEFSDEEILRDLEEINKEYNFTYKKVNNIEKEIAKLIFEEKIVANFQGRLELGPRALGNRSLLASPVKYEMLVKMNTLKGREVWRPLAPSVLFDKQSEWFEYEKFSPFMIKNCYVAENKKELLGAITHVDGTARIQSVKKQYNSKFYKIIKEFYKLSEIPVVINTSFNVKGRPIVCNVKDAVSSVVEMNIDYIAIGNYLVEIIK